MFSITGTCALFLLQDRNGEAATAAAPVQHVTDWRPDMLQNNISNLKLLKLLSLRLLVLLLLLNHSLPVSLGEDWGDAQVDAVPAWQLPPSSPCPSVLRDQSLPRQAPPPIRDSQKIWPSHMVISPHGRHPEHQAVEWLFLLRWLTRDDTGNIS